MAEANETGYKGLVCDAAISQFARVKMSGTGVTTAGASDLCVGVLRDASFAANDIRTVELRTCPGTVKMIASGAITAGVTVYAAASGKIASSGTVVEGVALNAAAADGDIVEVVSQYGANNVTSTSATAGVGYATGAGGTVTQATSRTTGVTLNKVCGQITLVSAAGSATAASFTVTNSAVAAGDVVIVNQKSGTDKYVCLVTAVAAGSFVITFYTTGGTTTEQPVFTFAVIKAVAA